MTKIKLGDIFEINTPMGKSYLHYIFKDKAMGDLVRVLPGIYSKQPADFSELACSKERYMIFFPLTFANRRKIVHRVGFYSPNQFEKPKYMRSEHVVRGEFLGWHIVDTETWHRQLVKNLTSEQKQLSPWGIWNDTLLIENIVNNWTLENWG